MLFRSVVTYDGSSRAMGIKLFLNGAALETEVVRDALTKDIVHLKQWDDMEPGKIHLVLGARFRDSGFKNGVMDDLQVFDTALTAAEIRLIGAPSTASASSRWSSRFSVPADKLKLELQRAEPVLGAPIKRISVAVNATSNTCKSSISPFLKPLSRKRAPSVR